MSSLVVAGHHYPRSTGEFGAWFGTDVDCLDYLEWLRWPDGFVCPSVRAAGRVAHGRWHVLLQQMQGTSVSDGRDDLRQDAHAAHRVVQWRWLFATQKDGVSAQSLQRTLEIGSYQTAWTMLHRLRSVLVRPGRERLAGRVEVDETYIGGEEPGLRGGRQTGKKTLVAIGVEVHEPKGIGRCRMGVMSDGSAASLHPFVSDEVEPGATVVTDAWMGYAGIEGAGLRPRAPQPARCAPARRRSVRAAARRASGGVARQAVVARHAPRVGRLGAPAGLPRRVRVPLQPPHLPQSRARVPPCPGARRRPRSGPLPRPG